jgi:multidrug efflux system membrane fusion protein
VDMRPLEVGDIADGIAIVSHGLDAGERVVTAGQYRLAPGARIDATLADASR